MPPRIFPGWNFIIARIAPLADNASIEMTNTSPATACRREPLRRNAATNPDSTPIVPAIMWRNNSGDRIGPSLAFGFLAFGSKLFVSGFRLKAKSQELKASSSSERFAIASQPYRGEKKTRGNRQPDPQTRAEQPVPRGELHTRMNRHPARKRNSLRAPRQGVAQHVGEI